MDSIKDTVRNPNKSKLWLSKTIKDLELIDSLLDESIVSLYDEDKLLDYNIKIKIIDYDRYSISKINMETIKDVIEKYNGYKIEYDSLVYFYNNYFDVSELVYNRNDIILKFEHYNNL